MVDDLGEVHRKAGPVDNLLWEVSAVQHGGGQGTVLAHSLLSMLRRAAD
jgi:hypothetical protein